MSTLTMFDRFRSIGWFRAMTGIGGILLAVFFLVWLLIGWAGWVPSMIDLFGVAGMRTPASFTVGGLLLAAISFWDF
ncbi:MAG: hypothetical protein WBN57_07240 [Gammaproteobacteria bacterium]